MTHPSTTEDLLLAIDEQALAAPDRSPEPLPKGVRPMGRGEQAFQRAVVLAVTTLPLVGLAAACWYAWGNGLYWSDVAAFVVMYSVSILGVTVGYHRLMTHQSFKTKRWVRTSLAVAGSLAVEGPVLNWVADHRRHHAFSDQPGDPHSPHVGEDGDHHSLLRGLWHAHIGWLFKSAATEHEVWAKDLVDDRALRTVDRLFFPLVAVSLLLPGAIGYALTGTSAGAISAILWGGAVRMFVGHHITWSTNSICHTFGKRPYATRDQSRNVWPLAILSMGESWHNAHHAFPSSAVHGLGRWEIDISAMVIRGLEKLGLAWDVKVASEGAQERARQR